MRGLGAGVVLLLVAWAEPAGGGEVGGRFRVQVGHEYDTNVRRLPAPVVADQLERVILDGLLRFEEGHHHLALNYLGGFKIFHHQDTENLVANKLAGSYHWAGGKGWTAGTRLLLRDTVQSGHDRDYRLARGELVLGLGLGRSFWLETYAAGRWFDFKPDRYQDAGLEFSHAGPVAGLRLRLRGGPGISAVAFYQAGVRFFDSRARRYENGILSRTTDDRLDLRHVAGIRVKHQIRTWARRKALLELSYTVSVNDSNSGGSSAMWHRLRMVVSLQLPWNLSLHLMGTLQFTSFPDGIYIEGDLYEPDADENENSIVLRLAWRVWRELSIVLHGGLYRNDFQSSELDIAPFARETIMLGLSYDLPF